jgi:Ca2+-binding EF-hand superfamily protein
VKLSAATTRELKELFRLYDQDGNGSIDMEELTYALQSGVMGSLGVSKADIQALMSQFDTDGDNVLSEGEFIQVFKDLI